MLICAVITGIVISWAQQPEDEEPHLPIGKPYWWVVLIALAPVIHVGYFFPSYLLPYLTMATSVEQHRQPHIAQKTFHEMQAEKTLRVLKTLALLQSHAKGLHRKKDKSERTSTAAEREAEAMKRMSKDELAELRQAFDPAAAAVAAPVVATISAAVDSARSTLSSSTDEDGAISTEDLETVATDMTSASSLTSIGANDDNVAVCCKWLGVCLL